MYSKSVGQIETLSTEKDICHPWKMGETIKSKGSAWFFTLPDTQKQYILTCFHCVSNVYEKNGLKLKTEFTGGLSIGLVVVAIIPDMDAAILTIDRSEENPLSSNMDEEDIRKLDQFQSLELEDDRLIKTKDDVEVYGYPMGEDKIKVLSCKVNGRQNGLLQLDGAINTGHSGGPVVHVKSGKVIGWITSGMTFANNISYAEVSQKFLQRLKTLTPKLKKWKYGDDVLISNRPNLGFLYMKGDRNRLIAIGARSKESCKSESSCACSTGVIIKWLSRNSPLLLHPFNAEHGDVICSVGIKGNVYKLSNDGEVDEMAASTKDQDDDSRMDFNDLLAYNCEGENPEVEIHMWKTSSNELVIGKCQLADCYENGLKKEYYPFQKQDYEVVGGVVISPLNGTILKHFPGLNNKLDLKDKELPALVIVCILPASTFSSSELLAGSILKSVNGIKEEEMKTMKQLRNALKQPFKEHYTLLETTDHVSAIGENEEIDKNRKEVLMPMHPFKNYTVLSS